MPMVPSVSNVGSGVPLTHSRVIAMSEFGFAVPATTIFPSGWTATARASFVPP